MSFQQDLDKQLVRYMELKPGTAAFIDARTPGSHLKDNYCIIGAGVAESDKQPVHIRETAGFNIGAAGQPPGIKNSLHSHTTAEIFVVFKGSFRFYWGNEGEEEVVLTTGDLISIPTNLFRGFEVVGRDYGFMYSVLGGDNSGGGVTWHPEVLKDSQGHGLYLRKDKVLVDTQAGEAVPELSELMPLLSEEEMAKFDSYTPEKMQKFVVRRDQYQAVTPDFDNVNFKQFALSGSPLASYDFQVKSHDEVSVHGLSLTHGAKTPRYAREEKQVLINFSGDTLVEVSQNGNTAQVLLTTGDVFNVPLGAHISLENRRGESFTYLIVGSDTPSAPVVSL